MSEQVTILAPAKLNLTLDVGDRDAAGMHPISSWMITVDLFDELEITRLEDGRFSRYAVLWHADAPRRSEIDWPITSDLAVPAHRALEPHVNKSLPIQMKLSKSIPVGGGLGGGSSNAANMLRGINDLFKLDVAEADLVRIAFDLGSDVPFLIRGGSALINGLGEDIEHHDDVPEVHAVLVFPESLCPTGEVYDLLDDLRDDVDAPAASPLDVNAVRTRVTDMLGNPPRHGSAHQLNNDLAEAACRLEPELAALRSAIEHVAEGPVHVSGSGSTLFVIWDDPMHAEALAGAINERLDYPTRAVRSCTPATTVNNGTSA